MLREGEGETLEALQPARSSTKAHGTSPHFASFMATTATVETAGWVEIASSTSSDEMFSPPEMMMSFERSFSSMYLKHGVL